LKELALLSRTPSSLAGFEIQHCKEKLCALGDGRDFLTAPVQVEWYRPCLVPAICRVGWCHLVSALSNDTSLFHRPDPRLGSKRLAKCLYKVLCYLLPTASKCLPERSQRLFSVLNPLACYLERILDRRRSSLVCLEEVLGVRKVSEYWCSSG
jgi:hypothetical protein